MLRLSLHYSKHHFLSNNARAPGKHNFSMHLCPILFNSSFRTILYLNMISINHLLPKDGSLDNSELCYCCLQLFGQMPSFEKHLSMVCLKSNFNQLLFLLVHFQLVNILTFISTFICLLGTQCILLFPTDFYLFLFCNV